MNRLQPLNDRSIMQEEVTENVKNSFQRLIPLCFSLLLLCLSCIPFKITFFDYARSAVGLVCVYYWLIHRPDIFNLFSVYLLGLVADILSAVPLGTNIFTYLILYILLLNLGRFFNGKPFVVTWYGFAILSLITLFCKWLMVSIYYSQFLPFAQILFGYLFVVAAYPILSLLNAFVQNYLIQDEV